MAIEENQGPSGGKTTSSRARGLARTIAWCLVAIAAGVALDQATKAAACAWLPAFGDWDGLFSIGVLMHVEPDSVRNMCLIAGLTFFAYAWSLNLPKSVLCLWTAGGLSNLAESAINGEVVDFLGIRSGADSFLVFNVADVVIMSGFVLLLGYAIADKIRWTDLMMGSAFLKPEDWGEWGRKGKDKNERQEEKA